MSKQIQKQWMNEKDRFSVTYLKGVDSFIEFAKSNNKEQLTTCPCPCKQCLNGKRVVFSRLRAHLLLYGMNPKYRVWFLHGEEQVQHALDKQDEEKTNVNSECGIGDLVETYYGLDERLSNDGFIDSSGQESGIGGSHVSEPDLPQKYYEYKRKAEEKLYPSCDGPETTLSAVVELHNVKKRFGWSGNSVTFLLSILKRWLPKGNTLPETYPVMKRMLTDLGMKSESIHACKNNCILYLKEYEDAMECPRCKEPRHLVREGKMGKKILKEPKKDLEQALEVRSGVSFSELSLWFAILWNDGKFETKCFRMCIYRKKKE